MERRAEDVDDAEAVKVEEAENNSKKDKIEEGNMDETALDAEKGPPTVISTENAEAEKNPSQGDKVLDAEKGLPAVIPTENAEAESNASQGQEEEAVKVEEEGKRSEEASKSKSKSKSKCSKLQSLIFGSLQRFFMAQVRDKSIIFPKTVPTHFDQPHVQGKVVGRYPLLFLILPLILTGLCCSGFAMSVTSFIIITILISYPPFHYCHDSYL